ncbi:hypothetical protein COBT_000443 [Conglomerata obtusa]
MFIILYVSCAYQSRCHCLSYSKLEKNSSRKHTFFSRSIEDKLHASDERIFSNPTNKFSRNDDKRISKYFNCNSLDLPSNRIPACETYKINQCLNFNLTKNFKKNVKINYTYEEFQTRCLSEPDISLLEPHYVISKKENDLICFSRDNCGLNLIRFSSLPSNIRLRNNHMDHDVPFTKFNAKTLDLNSSSSDISSEKEDSMLEEAGCTFLVTKALRAQRRAKILCNLRVRRWTKRKF